MAAFRILYPAMSHLRTLFIILLLAVSSTALGWQTQPRVVQPGAPGEPSKTLPPTTRAAKPAVSPADVEFVQGMIMHHQQAVEMTALIASRTSDKTLLELGKRISLSQSDEIKWMRHWLELRGKPASQEMPDMPGMSATHMMPGMLTPEQMSALRHSTRKEFDRLFLAGMVQHHRGALAMVKQLFDSAGSGQDGELFDFATDVDNTQRAEINLMERMLKEDQ